MADNKSPAILFYTGDFLNGCSDLTMMERGQYITLLCLQHQKGHLSQKNITLSVGDVSPDVLAKFKVDADGLYYNERMDIEMEKRSKFVSSRKENGKKKWEKEMHMQEKNDAYADASAMHMDMHMGNENININTNINTNTKLDIDNTKSNYDDVFDIFWNAYPKKIGKVYAKKCFEKIKPSAELVDKMVIAINEQKQTDMWKESNGKYIPNPSTWLNQQRWDDIVEVETAKPKYKNIGVIL